MLLHQGYLLHLNYDLAEIGFVLWVEAAFIQGIFGIAGEKRGELVLVSNSSSDELTPDQITKEMAGKILIGGSFLSLDAYKKAMSCNVAAVVVGGFNYYDLKDLIYILRSQIL